MEKEKQGFFARMFGNKQENEEENEPIIDEDSAPTVAQTLPHTLITYTPEQNEQLGGKEKANLEKILATLPPLRIGEINIVPFEAGSYLGGAYVKVFIRNGWEELTEEFKMEMIPLTLLDATGEPVARGVFEPENFGSLKFGETRYWTFAWHPDQMLKSSPDLSSFSVAVQ